MWAKPETAIYVGLNDDDSLTHSGYSGHLQKRKLLANGGDKILDVYQE